MVESQKYSPHFLVSRACSDGGRVVHQLAVEQRYPIDRLIMGCTFGSSWRLDWITNSHKFPLSVDISLKVREELHCLAEISHFWWQKPRSWAKKHIFLDESTGFEAQARLSFALSAWQRCSAVAGAATTPGGPWSTSLIRFTQVYKKMPLKSLNIWYLSIFVQFRSIPKYPRNIPDLSNLGTSNPLVNHPFPWWAQLVG